MNKPQLIKFTVDEDYAQVYAQHLEAALTRKFLFVIKPNFHNSYGEMQLRILCTDDEVAQVVEYINDKWQFIKQPELVS